MRQITPHTLWLGHVGDMRNLRDLLDRGIVAVVDLAVNEPIPTLTRELVYAAFHWSTEQATKSGSFEPPHSRSLAS